MPGPALPFKMPGSKRRTFAQIMPHLPRPEPGRGFVLPFFGTGADARYLSAAGYKLTALGDGNPHLVLSLRWLREAPARTVETVGRFAATFPQGVSSLESQRDWYFALRTAFNSGSYEAASINAAAAYVCIWRAAFNGLARCNATGKVNAPPGMTEKTGPKGQLIDLGALADFAAWLGTVPPVHCVDYAELMAYAHVGDVTYHDPPYIGTFDGYFGKRFDTDRLVRNIKCGSRLWAMSNALHPRWETDFPSAPVRLVSRSGTVSSKGTKRGKVQEILIVSPSTRVTLGQHADAAGPSVITRRRADPCALGHE